MSNVILTRSQEENDLLAHKITGLGFQPMSIPMIKKEDLDIDINLYSSYKNIIITSKFAAQIVGKTLSFLANLYVVGEESARILAQNKLVTIAGIYKNVEELQANFSDKLENYIYFCGNNITQNLDVMKVEIYHTAYCTTAITQHISLDNILIYSEMSAKHFILFLENHNLLQDLQKSVVITLSPKIAKVFEGLSPNIYSSANPSEKEILDLLMRYGKK